MGQLPSCCPACCATPVLILLPGLRVCTSLRQQLLVSATGICRPAWYAVPGTDLAMASPEVLLVGRRREQVPIIKVACPYLAVRALCDACWG